MKQIDLVELLADHADALNKAEDAAAFDNEAWLAYRLPGASPAILPLLQMAQAVKKVLPPLHAPLRLHRSFQHNPGQSVVEERPYFRLLWWGTAVLGSLLSITGLLVYLSKRWKSDQLPT